MRLSPSVLGFVLGVFVLFAVYLPAQAAEETSQPEVMQPVQKLENPYQNELRKIALELSTSLSDPELKVLEKLRVAFGMVRAIGLVEENVADAVEQCAAENPDIADDITTRHQSWSEAVSAERMKGEEKMEEYLTGDTFKNPDSIRTYFAATDKVATYIDEQMDKNLVTTPEACNHLLRSMDETEAKLTGVLGVIQWPDDTGDAGDKSEENPATEEPTAPAEATE